MPRGGTRRLRHGSVSAVVAVLAVSAPATAQDDSARATRWLLTAELGALHSTHPYQSGPGSYGVSLGVEREWTRRFAVRAMLGWTESFASGDDVSICHPTSAGTCFPDAQFPLRAWTLDVHGVHAPFKIVPLKLVAGGGLALPVGVRRNVRVTDHLEHDRAVKGVARVGASLGLGKSGRAPRLQYTRGWLSGAFASFDRMDQFALVVVF